MKKVTFGVALGVSPLGMPSAQELVAFGERAEALGLDSVWMGDHVVIYAPVHDPVAVLAALAARTERVKLGTGVMILPLRPPAIVAKSIATLDHLSSGRVIFGVGLGGEHPKEFQVCGVPVQERGARTDEGIRIIRRLWSEDDVTHEGRFWRFAGINMQPKPVQPGGPPIWVGGRSEAALRRAATLCDGWMGYMFTPEGFQERVARIRTIATEAGRELSKFTASIHLFLSLGDSREEARQRSISYITRLYNQPFDNLVDRYCLLGTSEQCAERLAEYIRAGAEQVTLRLTAAPSELPWYVERVAREVIPRARELAGRNRSGN